MVSVGVLLNSLVVALLGVHELLEELLFVVRGVEPGDELVNKLVPCSALVLHPVRVHLIPDVGLSSETSAHMKELLFVCGPSPLSSTFVEVPDPTLGILGVALLVELAGIWSDSFEAHVEGGADRGWDARGWADWSRCWSQKAGKFVMRFWF